MERVVLDAGLLRHRMMLQTRMADPDGQGGEAAPSWVDVAPLSAMIETGAARRAVDADSDRVRAVSTVTIRYREGVEPGMRFVFADRVLLIRTVSDPDERRTYLRLACEEETP